MTQEDANELERELRQLVHRIKDLKGVVDRTEYKRLFLKGQQLRLHLIRMGRMSVVTEFDAETNAVGFLEVAGVAVPDSDDSNRAPESLTNGEKPTEVDTESGGTPNDERSVNEFALPRGFLASQAEAFAAEQNPELDSALKLGVTVRPPKVFLQYAHVNADYKNLAIELADRLRVDGLESIIDQYVLGGPSEGWAVWMTRQLKEADFVLVLCSEENLKRFDKEQPPPTGTGATWEGHFIQQYLLDAGAINKKFVPVLLRKEDRAFIPAVLKAFTYYQLYESGHYDNLLRFLTNQPDVNAPPVSPTIKNLPPTRP
jgi:SEFIR domain-containing protein